MSSRQVHPIRTTETMPIISSAELKQNAEFLVQTADLLLDFDKNHTKSDYDAVAMVKSMAELMEKSLDLFLKNDPDPLDDRHPHRTHPDSVFGNVLKVIFKNDDFMTKLVVSYILGRDNVELNIQGCRFLLDCVPGLDSKVVFSDPDDFIPRLYQWALDGTNETLEGYGMGLLAAAHENPENASKYRNENAQLVTHALNRLKELQARQQQEESESESQKTIGQTDFSQLNGSHQENRPKGDKILENNSEDVRNQASSSQPPPPKKRRTEPCLSTMLLAETAPRVPSYQNLRNLDDSNSKWDILQPFIFGTQQVYPLSLATYQRYILQYLAACGEYQDLLLQTFEGNALQILLDYIDLEKSKDIRLTFDALKYLTSLLVHRKFALEFVERDGIQALLRLPRNSLASVGVVTALYYIAYNSDVMETLCQMNSEIIDDVVQYVLWCLEHSYESGKASACMFFSQALFYKALLKRFDQFDGPRKLYNYLATLTLMQNHDEHVEMTEEQVHTSTQCVKSSVATFRCYLVAHVFSRVEAHKKTYGNVLPIGLRFPDLIQGDSPDFKSMKHYEEVSWECETILLEMLRFTDGSFREAENLRKMGMVRLFLAVRSVSRDWVGVSTTFRNEMLVNALDALSIMLCLPSIQLELLTVHRYNLQDSEGFRVLIKTAAGKHDEDAAQRMSALGCIQRCVFMEPECWKALEYGMKSANEPTSSANSSARKYSKKLTPSIMSHLEKMWTEVRKVDGVYVSGFGFGKLFFEVFYYKMLCRS
uniref:Uncharacterized protein n=1 Tax=Caenorhabditis japonica TaxID=281687 RepID=A0A8R1DX82_CAEJA